MFRWLGGLIFGGGGFESPKSQGIAEPKTPMLIVARACLPQRRGTRHLSKATASLKDIQGPLKPGFRLKDKPLF